MEHSNANWYEVRVVDEEMTMEKQHLDEEFYEILACSEEHAKITVTLMRGDRYG